MNFSKKEQYRSELERLSEIIKLSVVCKKLGYSQSNMSKFITLKRYDLISEDKLNTFIRYIKDFC